jgi:hypothetical protein
LGIEENKNVKVAISQPTYLPWAGYFDLIDQVDCFVFLDTVQFEKRSWQQRNRIKTPEGLLFLTVPVIVKGRFEQRIKDVEIESAFFVRKHLRSIESNYRRAPHFTQYIEEFAAILEACSAGTRLADVNIRLVQWLCKAMGIQTPLRRSSEIEAEGGRGERLLKICRELNANAYLSALGSAGDLLDDLDKFGAHGIEVSFQNYCHPQYSQLFAPFQPYASAIDLLFNEGERALMILRGGRKAPLRPEQVQIGEIAGAASV